MARPSEMSSEAELRRSLARRLRAARVWTDSLFELVTPEGIVERPIAERHRLVFYVGHLEAFDWNLVCRDSLGQRSRNEAFERLFAFGIDPTGGEHPTDTIDDWPHLQEIRRWNRQLRADVDDALERAPFAGWLEEGWAWQIALEHRLMHAETLAYLLHRLDPRFKVPGPLPSTTAHPPDTSMVEVSPGSVQLGLSRRSAPHRHGWDNEYESHRVEVEGFELARLPVSNADWQRFIQAGGYRERALWTDDDWAWKAREGIEHPAFWRCREGRWWWRAMFGEVPLPESWPVFVSHAEATAYARWKGARLPTEPEWHRAIGALEPETWSAGQEANVGGRRFEPVASGSLGGSTALGIADLIGNGWEWTSTVFAPFPGFEPLPFYRGYSADFFDGNHFVMKGASAMTDLAFLRPTFRNWFQPHYQHVYAKFRLAKDL